MGTQIPLAKSTSVTLFQHHHQGEGEKQQQFLGQNLEERDSLVLVVNDLTKSRQRKTEIWKNHFARARRQIAPASKKDLGTSLKSSSETICASRATKRRGWFSVIGFATTVKRRRRTRIGTGRKSSKARTCAISATM